MRYALFLGCTVPARSRNYEVSARKVAAALGIELVDLEDFGCCGFPLRPVNAEAARLMAVRTLCIAEEHGLDVCTLCSACTAILTEASKELEDPETRSELNRTLGRIQREYRGSVKVRHLSRLLYEDVGVERIRDAVTRDLSMLRIAPHYGCHYLKPSSIYDDFDDPEGPISLDRLIEATGAIPVDYEDEKQCCGGAILAVDEDTALAIAGRKLNHIRAAEADAMCLVCPFCSVMYDDNQRVIDARFETPHDLPVLYYPQLLGLALGIESRELGFNMNRVKTAELLAKL